MPPKRKAPASVGYSDSAGDAANKRSKDSRPARKAFTRKSDDDEASSSQSPALEHEASSKGRSEGKAAAKTNGSSNTNGKEKKEPNGQSLDHSHPEESYTIVQREFYPAEMSNERCAMYNNGEIPRPIEVLEKAISDTADERKKIKAGGAVIHWYKRDLRLQDNKALHLASKKAQEAKVPLICVYLISPQDYQAHLTSAARVDFDLRTLAIMRQDLAELDIPLHVETIEVRKKLPGRLIDLAKDWKANHIFCNIEYEVDELRREAKLVEGCLKSGIDFTAVHDDTIIPPGHLQTGGGKQYAVYTPWYRSWVAHIHKNPKLLDAFDAPSKNPSSARKQFPKIFDQPIPEAPSNKRLSKEDKERYTKLYPAGEHEAVERVKRFIEKKISDYGDNRNLPAAGATAMVSVHHTAGTLSPRTSVRLARDANKTTKLDGGNKGIMVWISEVAWRDFYKHVLAHWPYICMHKPFKYEYTNIEWEYNDEHFKAWTEGKTGFPIVDAAMRQIKSMAYVHNRCRMIVASFLAKDLLLDWRMGERFFMENLIDGDFASNNGGWGFSASTGVDPQPYFRIFNPLLQSEKFDPDGEYIRKWLPELKDVKGKAIHDPYGRGAGDIAKKNGYPKPIVEHKACRERALARYKAGLGRDTA